MAVFSEEFLSANDFEVVSATFCCYAYGVKASEAVEMITTEPFSLKMYIGSAKTYGFCMFACFALMYALLSCLHTCMLSSDIKGAHRQNIRK